MEDSEPEERLEILDANGVVLRVLALPASHPVLCALADAESVTYVRRERPRRHE